MRVDRQIMIFNGIQALLLALIPVLANIGGDTGYWFTFLALVVLGWF